MENKLNSRLVGMLGFAMRAGRVVIGTDMVCRSMAKHGKAKPSLVLISNSASESAKDKISHKAEYYGIEWRIISIDSAELGRMLGKTSTPVTVAIADDNFAREIIKAIADTDN